MSEEKKPVVDISKSLVIWQCLVHLIPTLASIVILFVSFHGVYIGVDFPGFTQSDTVVVMLLQLSAKVHEILIVASLSQILLHAIRQELVHGDGIPLGLIGSGLSFMNLGYYFTKGFYGSLAFSRSEGKRLKRCGLICLVVVSGLTAILAGPASAVLIVPKSQLYPRGSTEFYLNGTAADFWPGDLTTNLSDLIAMCAGTESAQRDICPSGGFNALWQKWSSKTYEDLALETVPNFAKDLSGSRFYWPTHSPGSRVPSLYALGDPRSTELKGQPYTWLVQAHAASSVLLDQITKDWWRVVLNTTKLPARQIDDRLATAHITNAFAAVRCTGLQNIPLNSTLALFPSMYHRWDWAADLEFDTTWKRPVSTNHIQFRWMQLPAAFGAVSTGALLEMPSRSGDTNRTVIGCSSQLGWVPSLLKTDSYTFWSGWYPFGISFGQRIPSWTDPGFGQESPTNGRIAVGAEWLNLLTPASPFKMDNVSDWTPSTIETILTSTSFGTDTSHSIPEDAINDNGPTRLLEAVLASVLADGLSRTGSHRVFEKPLDMSDETLTLYEQKPDFGRKIQHGQDALVRPSGSPDKFTTLRATWLISGYAFKADLPTYLSMFVLLVHMLLALVHSVWIVFQRRVYQSWSSVAELVALAQNSRPAADVLYCTGAGISESSTYATVGQVRVRANLTDQTVDHVELVFTRSAPATSQEAPLLDGADTVAPCHTRSAPSHGSSDDCTELKPLPPLPHENHLSVHCRSRDFEGRTFTENLIRCSRASSASRYVAGASNDELVQIGRSYR